MMRNPLYFFSFLGVIGVGFVFGSLTIVSLLVLAFLLTHIPTIILEEKKLQNIFGADYKKYYEKTPRLLPKFSLYKNSEKLEFHPQKFTASLVHATYFVLAYPLIKILISLQTQGFLPSLFYLI